MSTKKSADDNAFSRRADELNLHSILVMLWAEKWLFLSVVLFFAVSGAVYSLVTPDIYRAEALVAPNQNESNDLSKLASLYSGISALTNIDFAGESGDKTTLAIEILRSRKFLSEFILRHDILAPLIAARGWDRDSNTLIMESNLFDAEQNKWVRKVSGARKQAPSALEAHEAFLKILSIQKDKETGFITIAVEHYSPGLARKWVDLLISDINTTIMENDVEEANQAIAFLSEQAATTALTDLKVVLFRLIEEQTKTVMLASVSDEYVLKTIDPAVEPEEPHRPRRLLIVVSATLLGIFLGALLSLIVHVRRQ